MYILLERTTYKNDGAQPAIGAYTYETIDEANGKAKQKMGNAMLATANPVESEGVIVLTEQFATVYQDYWHCYVEPEPEPEPENGEVA